MKMARTILVSLVAAAVAPLVIPFTGGWLYFVLHQIFQPGVWGLPPLQSLAGVSFNSTAVGYFFTWFLALPLVCILRYLGRYRLSYLLAAGALPALSLPFWQTGWAVSFLPALVAGMSTAYAYWRLTELGLSVWVIGNEATQAGKHSPHQDRQTIS